MIDLINGFGSTHVYKIGNIVVFKPPFDKEPMITKVSKESNEFYACYHLHGWQMPVHISLIRPAKSHEVELYYSVEGAYYGRNT